MNLSPSERYAAAKKRQQYLKTELAHFESSLSFPMDDFQVEGCTSLEDGKGVLVAAPTGAGKTLVGEFALHLAISRNKKAFYTTPIKALSNQKYSDFCQRFGSEKVGLLTGDTSINPTADVVVMTTEVLRNMLYDSSSALSNLGFVVMDEVHYLADRFRGAVWEEVIIHLPENVQMACLSATISNAEEFGEWLQVIRGSTDVIVSEKRPVPLWQHIHTGSELVDLFVEAPTSTHKSSSRKFGDAVVNPELVRHAQRSHRDPSYTYRAGRHRRGAAVRYRHGTRKNPRLERPSTGHRRISRVELMRELKNQKLLPAIVFIFSRAGCDEAITQCLAANLWLTSTSEQQTIDKIIAEFTATVPMSDLEVLGFRQWREGLLHGVAAHHAGLLPLFKEVVENLFSRGLIKAVFATETLALGINMPARSVILERLDKFNGESRVDITPGEYTQLTGRAGRRGIDIEGHAVVLWRPGLDPYTVAGLAARRTYPLVSSFKPTYNMSVNLIAQFGAQRSRTILESSFAQFQADRSVVGLAKKVRSHQKSLAGYEKAIECHLGDFFEYANLHHKLRKIEKNIRKSPLKNQESEIKIMNLKRAIRNHPCHGCHERDDHLRWAQRRKSLHKDTDALIRKLEKRTNVIAVNFDRICSVLQSFGYLQKNEEKAWVLTNSGNQLRHIYGDRDLLISMCLRNGTFKDLAPASLAAIISSMVYEPRRETSGLRPELSYRDLDRSANHIITIWSNITDREMAHKLKTTPEPEFGLVSALYRWAHGASLRATLKNTDLAAGDFVRWCKQVVDVLHQLSTIDSLDDDFRKTCRKSVNLIHRGVMVQNLQQQPQEEMEA